MPLRRYKLQKKPTTNQALMRSDCSQAVPWKQNVVRPKQGIQNWFDGFESDTGDEQDNGGLSRNDRQPDSVDNFFPLPEAIPSSAASTPVGSRRCPPYTLEYHTSEPADLQTQMQSVSKTNIALHTNKKDATLFKRGDFIDLCSSSTSSQESDQSFSFSDHQRKRNKTINKSGRETVENLEPSTNFESVQVEDRTKEQRKDLYRLELPPFSPFVIGQHGVFVNDRNLAHTLIKPSGLLVRRNRRLKALEL